MYNFEPEKPLRLAIFYGIGETFNLAILLSLRLAPYLCYGIPENSIYLKTEFISFPYKRINTYTQI